MMTTFPFNFSASGAGGRTNGTDICIEFDGTPQTIDLGVFFPAQATVMGKCFYECWTAILPGGGSGKYDFSDGYGGAHAMLRNPVNGNCTIGGEITAATNASPIAITCAQNHPFNTGDSVIIAGVEGNTAANGTFVITKTGATTFTLNGSTGSGAYTGGGAALGPFIDGRGVISFGADDVAYDNQWHHSATGVEIGTAASYVVQYYDGVPVGYTAFVGTRVSPQPSYDGHGYIGGSDHSNAMQRITQYRIFEGLNPNASTPFRAFIPEMLFGGQWGAGHYLVSEQASFLCDFFGGAQVTDKGQGYPVGTRHTANPKGVGHGVAAALWTDPPPFVTDATAPDPFNAVQPAGKSYTPAATPSGALIFDSIQRKNSTLSFNGIGGIGSTESGSLGPLVWQQTLQAAPNEWYAFGILNEQFVYIGQAMSYLGGLAWVDAAQTNIRIEVSRKAWSVYNCGVSTSILFRYKDANTYWYAFTGASDGSIGAADAQYLFVCKVTAGVSSEVHTAVACPASWTTLKVKTKSNGDYEVLCDATSVASGNDSAHADGTKCGVIARARGDSEYGGLYTGVLGLTARWRNFTVFDNA